MAWILLACTAHAPVDTAAPTSDTGTTAEPAENWLSMLGSVHSPWSDDGLSGVEIVDLDRPSRNTVTQDDGSWTLLEPPVSYVSLRFTRDTFLPVQIWISPWEALSPSFPYPITMGDEAALSQLYAQVGASPQPGKALVMVDVLDIEMSCIQDAPVEVSSAYDGAWQEYETGQWREANLSNADRSDLMFVNTDPGPVQFTVTDPDGNPCVGPENVVLVGNESTQVSFYCDYKVQR